MSLGKVQQAVELTPLGDLLVSTAQRAPDDAALIFPDHRHAYGSLLEAAYAVAGSLVALGVKPGDSASFKVPRYVRFVDDWPMSSTKVQKFRLREMFDRN